MRKILCWGVALGVGLVLTMVIHASPLRPNVLIIYTDDQGSVDVNCYGATDLETPNLDRLARQGVRFTQMLAPSAICSASRAGLLTGRFPARAGVPGNVSSHRGHAGMPAGELTIAELLRSNGYATGHIGKWHLGYTDETMPNAQGFDYSFGHMGGCIDNYSHFFYWNGPNRHDLWRNGEEIWRDGAYFGELMVEEVIGFIDREREGPFFIYWAINWPHYPLQATNKWRERYRDLPNPRGRYAAFVSTTDELIGRVLDHLDTMGLREKTLVIFQSDHGHSVEERTFFGGGSAGPYRGHKGTLFEGGLRVPAIVSLPGTLPQGEVRDQLVTGCDWWSTIAELTGVPVPSGHHLDGGSMVEVIHNEMAASPHSRFYWQLGGDPDRAKWVVRDGSWKLHGNASESRRPDGIAALTAEDRELFLVDLEVDVGESVNVARQHQEVVERLLQLKAEFAASIQESNNARRSE